MRYSLKTALCGALLVPLVLYGALWAVSPLASSKLYVSTPEFLRLLSIAHKTHTQGVGVWEWDGLVQLSYGCREGKYLLNYGKGVEGIWVGREAHGRSIEVFDKDFDGVVDAVREDNLELKPSSFIADVLGLVSSRSGQPYGQQIYHDAVSCLHAALQTTRAAR